MVVDKANEEAVATGADDDALQTGNVASAETNQASEVISIDDDNNLPAKETTKTKIDDSSKEDDNIDVDTPECTDESQKDERSEEEKEREAQEKEEAEKKRIEELREKYKDWPMNNIKEPHENDVMYGRGGGTNHHKGNKKYRKMVEDRKLEYVNSKRLDKPLVSLEIIRIWRSQLPTGRFLKQSDKTGLWDDVGDKKAREKTSQALREKAPQIRKQQEEEKEGDPDTKTTRFAADTKGNKKSVNKIKKAILARDHSLGREYLASDEAISINDFTWQDPFKGSKRESSVTSVRAPLHLLNTGPIATSIDPHGRENSQGSAQAPPPFIQPIQPPPPPDYYGRATSGENRREYSNGSLASWGAVSYQYPPQPSGPPMHRRSGSWTHPHPPQSPIHGAPHERSGSWGGGGGNHIHSFSFNPLPGANISRPADTGTFEYNRSGSGYWSEQMIPSGIQGPLPPPPPGTYGGYNMSGGSVRHVQDSYRNNLSPSHNAPSPSYNVMNIARSWSGGGEIQKTWSGDYVSAPATGNSQFADHLSSVSGADTSSPHVEVSTNDQLPRPTMVKRDTSNQNENYETKPSQIKRAALNRDQSATSNRLKKEFMPDYFDKHNNDMQTLQEDTEQIRLSQGPNSSLQPLEKRKPQSLNQEGRVSTMDAIMNDLLAKPYPLLQGDRVSTIDALVGLHDEVQDNPIINLDGDDARDRVGNCNQKTSPRSIPKPGALTQANRLTTTELFQLAGETDPLPM